MADYYSILGVTKQATQAEIKSAFRKLAKQYHPDKNPNNANAKELFNTILKAYETLTDSVKKKRYDLYYSSGPQTSDRPYQARKQKEWTFTEQDLKKRQYYQQYYKQKQKSGSSQTVSKPYNDYKYVLYATPIAVFLFMLIISLFTNKPEPDPVPGLIAALKRTYADSALKPKTGDRVYSGYFGPIQTFNTSYRLSLINSSGYDAVVVVVDYKTHQYIQHAYIENGYYVEFSSLPKKVYTRCLFGKNWDPKKILFSNVQGSFDSIVQFQDFEKKPVIFRNKTGIEMLYLGILDPAKKNAGFICTDTVFFKR